MKKLAVLDDYDGSISKLGCWKALAGEFEVRFFSTPQTGRALSDYEVIVAVRERTLMNGEFLRETKALRHLALTGRLSGQADLDALKERGCAVSFTDGSGGAPAELTIGLVVALLKGLHRHHERLRAGGWHEGPGTSLSGKTLGVLGLGRIGSKVAAFGKLMGMKVISWGPTDQGQEKQGVPRVSLAECLEQSDGVAVCLRLSEKTRGILGAPELARLRDGGCLINTSRAEIVDKGALYAELASGRISGAFDVYYEEPLPAKDPIRRFPNVLLSPHMGYVTTEVYQTFFSQVVENILAWNAGREFKNALA